MSEAAPLTVHDDIKVLSTVNAPYARTIDADTLASCLATGDMDAWIVHVATLFTDVRPELVLGFAAHHAISRQSLAGAYLAVKAKTGERSSRLEADLANSAGPHRLGPATAEGERSTRS